jgi:integrator complex subunit 5
MWLERKIAKHFQMNSSHIVGKSLQICNSGSKEKLKECTKMLSLLLVEMVSPDMMYNGLPWPEEEFMKVTIERDLKIVKSFENHPILWQIMMFLAEARPALCYSSVLIRAILAVQMNHWQSATSKKGSHSPKHLEVKPIFESKKKLKHL